MVQSFISQQRVVVYIINISGTYELHASIQHHIESCSDNMIVQKLASCVHVVEMNCFVYNCRSD